MDLGRRLLNQSLEEFSLTLRRVPAETLAAVVAEQADVAVDGPAGVVALLTALADGAA